MLKRNNVCSGKDQSGIDDYMMFLYAAPWVRCTPYIMGILTGYFLHKTKGKKLTIHPASDITRSLLVAIILWCASVAIALACVLGLYNNIKGIPISIATAASYNNFSRVGWALALAWVVIACQNNVAGKFSTADASSTSFESILEQFK
uniref:Uncharacterized protein n=1 Tax=Parascaris equorum TaxID=6256 RepID=A0A914RG91_PAREQ